MQTGDISSLDESLLKLVDKFTYLGKRISRQKDYFASVSSTEKEIDMKQTKAWTAIDKLSITWKSELEKKLDGNYTRMLRAILNKSWKQHPTKHQLYGHLPPITETNQVRRTRHAGHCWRSRDKLISDVLQWTPTYGRAKAGRPARIYI